MENKRVWMGITPQTDNMQMGLKKTVSTQKSRSSLHHKTPVFGQEEEKIIHQALHNVGRKKTLPGPSPRMASLLKVLVKETGAADSSGNQGHTDHYHLHRGESFLPLCTCYSPLHKPGHWTLQSLKWIGHLRPRHYSLWQASWGRHKRQVLYGFAKFTTPTPIHLCNCQIYIHTG